MKRLMFIGLFGLSSLALARTPSQELFTIARDADCSSGSMCMQVTESGQFTMHYDMTDPLTTTSREGLQVYSPYIEIANSNGGMMDLNIMSIKITASDQLAGDWNTGTVALQVLDRHDNWVDMAQWSAAVGDDIYIMFLGHSPISSPLVQGVKKIRLKAANGTTAFTIGMLQLTAY